MSTVDSTLGKCSWVLLLRAPMCAAERERHISSGVQGMQVLRGNIDKTRALGVEKELVMVVCNMQDILVRMLGSL